MLTKTMEILVEYTNRHKLYLQLHLPIKIAQLGVSSFQNNKDKPIKL